MSQPNALPHSQAIFEQAEQVLRESREFFQQHGLDPEKAQAYFDSITTPELRAQAQAAFESDMLEIEQEVREKMAAGEVNKRTTRSSSRPLRQMI